MSSGKSALIIGATGATGKHLLQELLQSSAFTRVGEYGRRVTSQESINVGKDKLEQKTIDFEKLEEAGLKEGKWDVVYITLGTTRAAAGSAAAFEKIDKDYVLNAARLAKHDDSSKPQRVVYLSVSPILVSPVKPYPHILSTLTEVGLAALGYDETIIVRPGLITERGGESRLGETIAGYLFSTSLLAKAIRISGELGVKGLPAAAQPKEEGQPPSVFTSINHLGLRGLLRESKD
ncbi:hypothetical protein NLI96_g2844 [Meripilus lineatus]|uniref:NAD-dependent epimerase/dehydratase domain-containing protein n=1 Tax=Meripilus lineatus TaxID=2056292 RepID=A0AAD5YG80_9APHY|nr:hypothetical protein NLI96_g2844 [Physisporinus lineatus]